MRGPAGDGEHHVGPAGVRQQAAARVGEQPALGGVVADDDRVGLLDHDHPAAGCDERLDLAAQRLGDAQRHVEPGGGQADRGRRLLARLLRLANRVGDGAHPQRVRPGHGLRHGGSLGRGRSGRRPRGEQRSLGVEAALEDRAPDGLGHVRPAHLPVGQQVEARLGLGGQDFGYEAADGGVERSSVGSPCGHVGLERSQVDPVGGHAGPSPLQHGEHGGDRTVWAGFGIIGPRDGAPCAGVHAAGGAPPAWRKGAGRQRRAGTAPRRGRRAARADRRPRRARGRGAVCPLLRSPLLARLPGHRARSGSPRTWSRRSFVAALARCGPLRPATRGAVAPWLFSLARHKAIDLVRREAERPQAHRGRGPRAPRGRRRRGPRDVAAASAGSASASRSRS